MIRNFLKRKDVPTAQIMISLLPAGIALAKVDAARNLRYYDFFEHAPDDQEQALLNLAERYQFAGTPCHWILAPGQYQLIMTDALNIPFEEIKIAIKWKIKEQLDYPIDNVTLDVFAVPEYGTNRQHKKIFVVATDKNWLTEKIKQFQNAYLPPVLIDIADLALRNLIEANSKNLASVVLLHIYGNSGKLILYCNHNIYLIRQLSFNMNVLTDEQEFFDVLLLEIQRSIDYCQFELKLDLPQTVWLTPTQDDQQALLQFLHKNLNIAVDLVDLNHLLVTNHKLSTELQQKFLYPLSAAMTVTK